MLFLGKRYWWQKAWGNDRCVHLLGIEREGEAVVIIGEQKIHDKLINRDVINAVGRGVDKYWQCWGVIYFERPVGALGQCRTLWWPTVKYRWGWRTREYI